MPPYATSTVTVPRPRTSTLASRWVANAGTLRKVTLRTFPWRTSASTAIRPAGVSSLRCVTGSTALTMPVSISTVTTQMVLVPDIGGYSRADHVRQEELAGPERRPHPPAHAARAARLPGVLLQPDLALQPSGSRCRLRHHGAGGVPADVRYQHHLRGHGADRDRHGQGRRTRSEE